MKDGQNDLVSIEELTHLKTDSTTEINQSELDENTSAENYVEDYDDAVVPATNSNESLGGDGQSSKLEDKTVLTGVMDANRTIAQGTSEASVRSHLSQRRETCPTGHTAEIITGETRRGKTFTTPARKSQGPVRGDASEEASTEAEADQSEPSSPSGEALETTINPQVLIQSNKVSRSKSTVSPSSQIEHIKQRPLGTVTGVMGQQMLRPDQSSFITKQVMQNQVMVNTKDNNHMQAPNQHVRSASMLVQSHTSLPPEKSSRKAGTVIGSLGCQVPAHDPPLETGHINHSMPLQQGRSASMVVQSQTGLPPGNSRRKAGTVVGSLGTEVPTHNPPLAVQRNELTVLEEGFVPRVDQSGSFRKSGSFRAQVNSDCCSRVQAKTPICFDGDQAKDPRRSQMQPSLADCEPFISTGSQQAAVTDLPPGIWHDTKDYRKMDPIDCNVYGENTSGHSPIRRSVHPFGSQSSYSQSTDLCADEHLLDRLEQEIEKRVAEQINLHFASSASKDGPPMINQLPTYTAANSPFMTSLDDENTRMITLQNQVICRLENELALVNNKCQNQSSEIERLKKTTDGLTQDIKVIIEEERRKASNTISKLKSSHAKKIQMMQEQINNMTKQCADEQERVKALTSNKTGIDKQKGKTLNLIQKAIQNLESIDTSMPKRKQFKSGGPSVTLKQSPKSWRHSRIEFEPKYTNRTQASSLGESRQMQRESISLISEQPIEDQIEFDSKSTSGYSILDKNFPSLWLLEAEKG
mmetsp:Transcript_1600/g.2437  ORF Transcript_1600/g.2437 Transcript_1600/m.2437 type:complete len:753 (+) Transcript_1600:26-2284(+)